MESFLNFIYTVTGSRHILLLAVEAGFHSDIVESLPVDYSDPGSILGWDIQVLPQYYIHNIPISEKSYNRVAIENAINENLFDRKNT